MTKGGCTWAQAHPAHELCQCVAQNPLRLLLTEMYHNMPPYNFVAFNISKMKSL